MTVASVRLRVIPDCITGRLTGVKKAALPVWWKLPSVNVFISKSTVVVFIRFAIPTAGVCKMDEIELKLVWNIIPPIKKAPDAGKRDVRGHT